MKHLKFSLIFLIAASMYSQNTEIFLFDIVEENGTRSFENEQNISKSPDYDSQPSFLAKDVLIYAGTRNGQTEILQYTRGAVRQLNYTTDGGEYSPQFIPGQRGISAVRLDPDGLQRLYKYLPRNKKTPLLIDDAVVAYYTWFDKNIIVSADIVENELHLSIHNLKAEESEDLQLNVGRSFHKIPQTQLVSFIDKSSDISVIKSINPLTREITEITPLLKGMEDIAWLNDGSILATLGPDVYIKKKDKDWQIIYSFDKTVSTSLSRIAVSPDDSQVAIVAQLEN